MTLVDLLPLLRWTLLGLSAIVLLKTARGWLLFGWGHQRLHTFVSSLVFVYGLAALSIQSAYLLEGVIPPPPHARLVVSLSLNIIATIHAMWVLSWLRRLPVGSLRAIANNMAVAVAVAELAELAPDVADELAEAARRITVERVTSGGYQNERP